MDHLSLKFLGVVSKPQHSTPFVCPTPMGVAQGDSGVCLIGLAVQVGNGPIISITEVPYL